MMNVNKVKLLSERTSGVTPVIFFNCSMNHFFEEGGSHWPQVRMGQQNNDCPTVWVIGCNRKLHTFDLEKNSAILHREQFCLEGRVGGWNRPTGGGYSISKISVLVSVFLGQTNGGRGVPTNWNVFPFFLILILHPPLMIVIFIPHKKYVNCHKTDFATKQRKMQTWV